MKVLPALKQICRSLPSLPGRAWRVVCERSRAEQVTLLIALVTLATALISLHYEANSVRDADEGLRSATVSAEGEMGQLASLSSGLASEEDSLRRVDADLKEQAELDRSLLQTQREQTQLSQAAIDVQREELRESAAEIHRHPDLRLSARCNSESDPKLAPQLRPVVPRSEGLTWAQLQKGSSLTVDVYRAPASVFCTLALENTGDRESVGTVLNVDLLGYGNWGTRLVGGRNDPSNFHPALVPLRSHGNLSNVTGRLNIVASLVVPEFRESGQIIDLPLTIQPKFAYDFVVIGWTLGSDNWYERAGRFQIKIAYPWTQRRPLR